MVFHETQRGRSSSEKWGCRGQVGAGSCGGREKEEGGTGGREKMGALVARLETGGGRTPGDCPLQGNGSYCHR